MSAPAIRHPGELRWETRLLGVVTATLVVFGLASTYGAASLVTARSGANLGLGFALRQLAGAVIGGVVLTVVARWDYHRWRDWAWPILGVTALLLLVPLLPMPASIAPNIHGAKRWLRLGPMSMQPSELARLTIVIWCAMLGAKKGALVRDFKKGVVPFLVGIGAIALLIVAEPNLSMATLVALIGCTVLFAAGARIGHFIVLGLLGGVGVAWKLQHGFRAERMKVFMGDASSDAAFQIKNSLIGIGSGGAFGVGFGQGQQKLGYLPFAYSDFLFSTIGEEWGFVGVVVVALLFVLFCWLGFRIARTAPDLFGQLLATGVTCTIGITAFMHMAVSLGLMPTTGLTLPFMSFGGSSLVISLLGTGILLSIGRRRGRPVAEEG